MTPDGLRLHGMGIEPYPADFNRMLGSLETERAALLGRDHLLTTLALDRARTTKMWRAMFFIASGVLAAKVALDVAR